MKALAIILSLLTLPTWASTVLFIGDSQSMGPFGDELDRLLRTQERKVVSYASCGSAPHNWYDLRPGCGVVSRDIKGKRRNHGRVATPSIKKLLALHKPQIVIMQFGGNLTNVKDDKFITRTVQKIVKTVKDSGAQCYWINNPDKRKGRSKLQRVWDLMENAVGEDCPVFRSQEVTSYPDVDENRDGKLDGDGLHYSFPAGKPIAQEWARKAFADFQVQYPL